MKDITNEVKDFKKFYIIPKEEVAMEVHSANADDAMICFAWAMESDMNQYFRAVTEEEYNEIIQKRNNEIVKQDRLDFFFNEVINGITPDEKTARKITNKAYEIYNKAGSYPYCDIETEYDAINRAVEEYKPFKIRVYDIDWETDDEDVDLPTEVIIDDLPADEMEELLSLDGDIADELSDRYGFLVNSFIVEVIRQ